MSRKHILVVDDEEEIRSLMSCALRHAGFLVTTACDGKHALALLDERDKASAPVDVLVTDFDLPGLTGLELIDALRDEGIRVPSFVMSGNLDETLSGMVRARGCAGFLEKPFAVRVLIEQIHQLFDGRS